jgi:hypothetical protein
LDVDRKTIAKVALCSFHGTSIKAICREAENLPEGGPEGAAFGCDGVPLRFVPWAMKAVYDAVTCLVWWLASSAD